MTGHDILVLGASAGGVGALSKVVSGFPADLPAAVFIVQHVAPFGTSSMPAILSRSGPLEAVHPRDSEAIEPGRIYVAPPDHHLVIEPGRVRTSRAPTENGHRPAVDVLFRTAARENLGGVRRYELRAREAEQHAAAIRQILLEESRHGGAEDGEAVG